MTNAGTRSVPTPVAYRHTELSTLARDPRSRPSRGTLGSAAYGPASRLERMSTNTPGDVPVRRIDRVLAFMSLGLLVLSIVSFFAIMIGSASGADMRTGIWPLVGVLVYIAPIVAFVLMLTVLIMSFVRRARANRGG